MPRTRAQATVGRREGPAEAGGPVAPLPAVGNRALAGVLGVQRVDDWSGEGPSSKNLKPIEVAAPAGSGGSSVVRVALFGIVDNEMLTGRAIVVLPKGIPPTGGTFDVLVHLHGYEVWSEAKPPDKPSRLIWGTGYEDARKRGGDEPIDIGVMKIEQEMAAAGGRMIGVFPQGDKVSDFTAARDTKGFNLRDYVTAAFTRLQAWIKANDGSIVPKEAADKVAPGRISLSSHSGGDEGLSEMVGHEPIPAGGSGAADGLAGLFLFDTMIEGKAERKKAAKDKPTARDPSPFLFEGRVEEYVKKRWVADLGAIQGKPSADQVAWVERNGFRLTVVYRKGSDYGEPGDRLKAVVDSWFADLAALPADKGASAAAQAALRKNYVVQYATTKEHMEVMTHGALSGAIKSLPLGKATGAAPPTGSAGKTTAPTPTPAPTDAGVQRAAASTLAPAGNRALARLLAPSGPTLMRDDDEQEPDYAAEFASFVRRGAVEGGLEGYKDIRDLLIGHFGSIAHANEYYRHVKQQTFAGVSPGPWVHDTTLGPALKKAEKLIADRGWTNDVVGHVSEAGGFNIRRNRNQRAVLSDHSFGWAVDFDADLNPNLAGHFPGRAVAGVTGKDIVTEAMDRVNQGGTAQELLGSFDEIRAASDAVKNAFADETSLDAAMRDYLVTRLKVQVDADVKVLEMVRSAAGSGRAGAAGKRALKDLLKAHWGSIPDMEAELEREDREEIVANQGWAKWQETKERRTRAGQRAEATFRKRRADAVAKAGRLRAAGASEADIAKKVTDPLSAAEVKDFQDELDALVDRAAGTLVGLWQIYVSSFERGRTGGARRAAASEGDPGTVAAHGFMNMPSRLAAALTGSDGGDLDWLGSSGVHDVMHFQLKSGDRPAL